MAIDFLGTREQNETGNMGPKAYFKEQGHQNRRNTKGTWEHKEHFAGTNPPGRPS